MVAVVFSTGSMVETEGYQDMSSWAFDPEVEALRQKIPLVEDIQFPRDYHSPNMRSISNAVQVQLKMGHCWTKLLSNILRAMSCMQKCLSW